MTRTNQEVCQRRGALAFQGPDLLGLRVLVFCRGSGLSYSFALGVVFWFGSQLIVVICPFD